MADKIPAIVVMNMAARDMVFVADGANDVVCRGGGSMVVAVVRACRLSRCDEGR